jgi:MFS family permease
LRGNRNLQLLFIAGTMSSLIDWLYSVALFVVAYRLTNSAELVGLLTFARLLPYALLLPLTGSLTDRFDRRILMAAACVGRALCMLGLIAVRSDSTLWLAFPLVLATTCLAAVFRPALLSSLPGVVSGQELVRANSVVSQVDAISFGAGPAIGGVLLTYPESVSFLVSALGLLVAGGAIWFAHIRPAERDKEEGLSLLGDLVNGFRFLITQHQGVLLSMAVAVSALTLATGAFWAYAIVLTSHIFHVGPEGLGLLCLIYAVAGILGGFVIDPLIVRLGTSLPFIVAAIGSAIFTILFGLSPAGILPFVVFSLIGISDALVKVTASTLLQCAAPERLLGHLFGAFESVQRLTMIVGALTVGTAISILGARMSAVLYSAVGLALVVLCTPWLLKLSPLLDMRVLLRRVPALDPVSFSSLDELARHVQLERVPKGTNIVREGDVGDRLYIVRRGSVDVLNQADGREVAVARLRMFDYFGETALLSDAPRNATVRASEPAELYTLTKSDFQALLARSEGLAASMTEESKARVLATRNQLSMRL